MKQNSNLDLIGKEFMVKSLTSGLLPVVGCSLLGVIVLARGFLQPGKTVMEIMLLPISAYIAGIGFMSVLFLKEWNKVHQRDREDQEVEQTLEIEQRFGTIKTLYLTYQEEEANIYLSLGWTLIKVPVRFTDVDGQQLSYLLGWAGQETAPRPVFDSKTRKFAMRNSN